MKNILLYTLLLTATLGYGQGLLPEENIQLSRKNVQKGKKYEWKEEYSEGLAYVFSNDKYGFVDTSDNIVIPIKYDYVRSFLEGLAGVKLNGKCGFIDTTGKIVIPFVYESFSNFVKGLALVTINNKSFYINKKGECVRGCKNAPADHPIAK